MKKIVSAAFLIAATLIGIQTFAKPSPAAVKLQQPLICDTIPDEDEASVKFERVEEEAKFPGGEIAWRQFLEQNLNAAIPANKNAPVGVYTVVIQFVVDRDGHVSDIKPLTKHGYGMEAEVVRLLRKAPKWIPAMQNGRTVKAYRKQPVTFQVAAEEKKKKRNKGN